MVMGLGMRTIWISLRAMNYTDRAFRAAIGNLDNLSKKEREHLKNALAMAKVAQMNIQTGLLYGAMLGMVGGQMFTLLSSTQAGAQYMYEFGQIINDVKVAFADAFFEVLRPALDVVKGFLNLMKDNAPLRTVVVWLTLIVGALMGLYAGYLLVSGIRNKIIAQMTIENFIRAKGLLIKFKDAIANITLAASNHVLATSLLAVGAAAAIGFGLFYALKDVLGPLPAAIIAVAVAVGILATVLWSAAAALSIVTVGVAAGVGLAAFTQAVSQSKSAAGFAGGTRGLPYDGLFVGHKGEIVYNPATARPTGIGVELGQAGVAQRTIHNDVVIDLSGSTIKTEADEERLVPLIKKTVRDAMLDRD